MTQSLVAIVVGILGFVTLAQAHQGHSHSPPQPQSQSQPAVSQNDPKILIGQYYSEKIQPIFEKKCFDCHGTGVKFPWYYKLPIAKQFIDHDISDAKEHIDMSKGYPFISHASPLEDLEAIRDTIQEGDMPPFIYRLAHRESILSAEEKEAVTRWANQSIALIKAAH